MKFIECNNRFINSDMIKFLQKERYVDGWRIEAVMMDNTIEILSQPYETPEEAMDFLWGIVM